MGRRAKTYGTCIVCRKFVVGLKNKRKGVHIIHKICPPPPSTPIINQEASSSHTNQHDNTYHNEDFDESDNDEQQYEDVDLKFIEESPCCAICLEEENKFAMVITSCKHVFHVGCILQWRETQSNHEDEIMSCPSCRDNYKIIRPAFYALHSEEIPVPFVVKIASKQLYYVDESEKGVLINI